MNHIMNKHEDWQALQEGCMQCVGCPLHATRTNVVFGVGNPDSPILIVGEGPGEQEDLQGYPFVGPAGKLLDDMLKFLSITTFLRVFIMLMKFCRMLFLHLLR